MEYLVRFLAGGLVVSSFAILGDVMRPKSFAGLFSAAPSVALVTLSLAFLIHGSAYAAAESKSMALGGAALLVYSIVVCRLLSTTRYSGLAASMMGLFVWAATTSLLQYFLGASS